MTAILANLFQSSGGGVAFTFDDLFENYLDRQVEWYHFLIMVGDGLELSNAKQEIDNIYKEFHCMTCRNRVKFLAGTIGPHGDNFCSLGGNGTDNQELAGRLASLNYNNVLSGRLDWDIKILAPDDLSTSSG